MRRETQNLLLLLLGGALLKISFTGAYLRYVKPSLLPWLIVAGVVIVLLASFAIVRDVRSARSDALDQDEACAGDDEHASRSPWMLLLPVFAIFLVAPPALGADSVRRAGETSPVPERPTSNGPLFAPLPAGKAPSLRVSEFVTRAVWDTSGALNNRSVRLTGFVVPTQPPPNSRSSTDHPAVYLARLRINCCAADATPVKVALAGPAAQQAARLRADTWIAATGTLRQGSATGANNYVPTLEVTEVRTVPVPREPYER